VDIRSLLGLNAVRLLGNKRLLKLLEYFDNDAEAAWTETKAWGEALELSGKVLADVLSERSQLDLDKVYAKFCASGASLITIFDADYPSRLHRMSDPPVLLYYKGELPPVNHLAFAIVGSRQCTAYGRQVAEYLAQGLARSGAWIISGLARGIDSCAHRGAVDNGGKTIGVLGCGIDMIYPRENAKLFKEVEQNGCIITEYAPGTPAVPSHFPVRNRIISALSDGVIVAEAKKQSGTQITVDYALEQGREVYAVPGPIFSPQSAGVHHMMRAYGVKPVTCAEDILEDFGQIGLDFGASLSVGNASFADGLSPTERKLLDFLSVSRHFNEIAAEMNMEAGELAPLLTLCELRQYISQQPGQYYIRNNI